MKQKVEDQIKKKLGQEIQQLQEKLQTKKEELKESSEFFSQKQD